MNFDWNQIRAFLATVEEGSLSAAARALQQTQPTLSRQVAALEEDLNVVLFERVGRNLQLTPSGKELLGHVREMGEAAARISLTASGQSQEVAGHVRITASDIMSAYHLPPLVTKLREVAPKIDIEIIASNDIQDLQHREADIAIRHLRPEQPELIAKLVQEPVAYLYAAKSYLDKVGRPKGIEDLANMEFISFGPPERMIEYMAGMNIHLPRSCFTLNCENGIVAWNLVRLGNGIAAMEEGVANATPGVEVILPRDTRIQFPVWLTTHRELHTSKRIRLVYDFLAAELADYPTKVSKELI